MDVGVGHAQIVEPGLLAGTGTNWDGVGYGAAPELCHSLDRDLMIMS